MQVETTEDTPHRSHNNPAPSANTSDLGSADGFMNIPDGIDEELPFN